MNAKEELDYDLKIALHNLYVAKTEVLTRQEDVDKIKSRIEKLGVGN